MNVARLLRRSGEVFADRPAMYRGSELLFDYRTLAARAASLAGFLRGELGIGCGDPTGAR
jgi:long-chain acyl-CoA synthetase